jgi:hypothetical protein
MILIMQIAPSATFTLRVRPINETQLPFVSRLNLATQEELQTWGLSALG